MLNFKLFIKSDTASALT